MNNAHEHEATELPDPLDYPRAKNGAPDTAVFVSPADVAGMLRAMDAYTGSPTRAPQWVSAANLLRAYRAMPSHARGGAWQHLNNYAKLMGEIDPSVYSPLRDAFAGAVPHLRIERVADLNERQVLTTFRSIIRNTWEPAEPRPAAENQA